MAGTAGDTVPPSSAGTVDGGDDPDLRVTMDRLEAVFRLAPIGIGVVDLEGRAVMTNDALREMLGYSVEEFAELHWRSFTHPDDVEPNLVLFQELTAGRSERFEMDKRFFHKDGRIIWGHLTTSLLRDVAGGPAFAIGMLENITERKALEEQLRTAEETYRLIIEEAPAVVYVGDVDPDRSWHYVSPQIECMLGYGPDEWLEDADLRWRCIHPDDRAEVELGLRALQSLGRGNGTVLHFRLRRRDGHEIWVRDEFRLVEDADGREVVRGVLLDATREKRLEAELERQAFHDTLTHLANRELFGDRVAHCLERTVREPGRHDAVVFVDLDDFKTINDSLGHAAGDDLLRSVAHRIRGCLRHGDTAGRLGGDEFAILVEGIDRADDAIAVAERIQREIEQPHRLADKTLVTSASLGVAYLRDADNADAVLRNADLAMYRAKELGKGRVACYDPALHATAVRRLDLRSALEEALVKGELALHLQPVVDLGTTEMVGAEALLRWQHPIFGAVSPDDFIPVAEETGSIGRIGDWVLRQACQWLAARHREGATALTVSVNVSPVQLQQPGFGASVGAIVRASGVDPRHLVLEVTEQALMSDRSWIGLAELQRLGVRIAMDDFGTGYASLAYLGRLAVDQLKIDRMFIDDLATSERAAAVPRAIIELACSLELQVVAEGIENEVQWQRLRALGCRSGQGYLFSRPVPLDEAAGLVGRPLLPVGTAGVL